MSERGDDDVISVGDSRRGSRSGYFSFEEIRALITQMRQETMEQVETPPDGQRNSFGYGMVNGQLRAARRFDTLLDELMRKQHLSEEHFDEEDDWDNATRHRRDAGPRSDADRASTARRVHREDEGGLP